MKRSSYWSKTVAQPEVRALPHGMPELGPATDLREPHPVHDPREGGRRARRLGPGPETVGYSGTCARGRPVRQSPPSSGRWACPRPPRSSSTTRTALLSWQSRQGLRGTAVTDAMTWYRMTRPHAAEPVSKGLDGDVRPTC